MDQNLYIHLNDQSPDLKGNLSILIWKMKHDFQFWFLINVSIKIKFLFNCIGDWPILSCISCGGALAFPEWHSRMFWGFRSRCTTPLALRAFIAPAETITRKNNSDLDACTVYTFISIICSSDDYSIWDTLEYARNRMVKIHKDWPQITVIHLRTAFTNSLVALKQTVCLFDLLDWSFTP